MRAVNRPPSLRDLWWKEHQRTCGGKFSKIKEPEGYGKKKGKSKNGGGDHREKGTSRDIKILGGQKKGQSSKEVAGPFEGRGFVLGKRSGEGRELTGKRRRKGNGDNGHPSKSSSQQADASLREKMLLAAERRRALALGVKSHGDTGNSSSLHGEVRHSASNKSCQESTGAECIVIPDDPEDSAPTILDPSPSPPKQHVNEDQTVDPVRLSPPDPAPGEWYEHMEDYKTCPVCGMGNIPSTIIDVHVSLCLEAEEEFRIIIDDDDL